MWKKRGGWGRGIGLWLGSILLWGCVLQAREEKRGEGKKRVAIGINLNGISDWSTEFPFLDHFKSSRRWVTQREGSKQWDTGEYDSLQLDERGWVKSLPKGTRVSTIVGHSRYFPSGRYVVLYEGKGRIEYGWGAKKIEDESKPGRDIIWLADNHNNGILLTIVSTDPEKKGDYIRNITIVAEKQEKLKKQGEIFNPLFLEKIKPFAAIRFMDWMKTNNSQEIKWENRPKITDATYSIKGVPLEVMVALGNRLNKDVWFNIPHQADDEYIREFAKLVKKTLNPNLKAYVEYSNEVWNKLFTQSEYARQQAKKRWGDENAYLQWYGMRVAQMCDIWKTVFDKEKNRVICVISTHTAKKGTEKEILDCPLWVKEGNKPCYQHQISAYAIAGYFGGSLGKPENESLLQSWLQESDGGFKKAFAYLLRQQDETMTTFSYHSRVAKSRGLELVAYEGGQHIVGIKGIKDNERLTNFFIQLNRHPQMYNLYRRLLSDWEKAGGGLFLHFNDIRESNKHGSWGSLEYLQQSNSPKYDALIDFIRSH